MTQSKMCTRLLIAFHPDLGFILCFRYTFPDISNPIYPTLNTFTKDLYTFTLDKWSKLNVWEQEIESNYLYNQVTRL